MFEQPFAPGQTRVENTTEALELHQIAQDFLQEVDYRVAFEAYCAWYNETARKHQAELSAMQQDIPLLSWFLGFSRDP
jgi:hypothetical protein